MHFGSPETSVHLLWFSYHSRPTHFWPDLLLLLCTRFKRNFEFSFEHILFGLHDFSRVESSVFYKVKLLFLLARYLICKSK